MKRLLPLLASFVLVGCITAPDGRKGIGFEVPVKYKETDLGSIIVGWVPPDSVSDGRYGAIFNDGKNFFPSSR